MKPISFEKYIKTCRRILESSADFETEGLLYDEGRQLKINFSIAGVKYNLMTIGLQYDERSGYWYPKGPPARPLPFDPRPAHRAG